MNEVPDQICECFDPPPGCYWETRDGLSGWRNPKQQRTEYYPYGETVNHRQKLYVAKHMKNRKRTQS